LAVVWTRAGSGRVTASALWVLIVEEVYRGDNPIGFGAILLRGQRMAKARLKARQKHGEKHGESHIESHVETSGSPVEAQWKPSGKAGGNPGGNPGGKHGYRI